MLQKDNIDIISKLNNGDEFVFEEIYKHFTPPLYSFATQYVSKEKAEGVVQETMIWLWTNKEAIIPEMSLKSLLFTIVKNKCLNNIKKEQTQSRILEEIKLATEQFFDDHNIYFENELLSLFHKALEGMPELYSESFKMSRFQQMTHSEIAEKLNVSKQTINYRLSRALEHLRRELKDYLPIILLII